MSLTETFKITPRSTLQSLIHILRDGQEGFRKASADVRNTRLKDIFSRLSLQRSRFAGELQAELLTLDVEDPRNEGTTLSGALRCGWTSAKPTLVSNDEYTLLTEAERGEDSTATAYREALETELPLTVRQVISKQRIDIRRALNEVRMLRDAAKC